MSQIEYANNLKQAAISMGRKLVLEYIKSKIPFLGNIFFGPIVGFFIGKVLEIAFEKTELGLFFLFIDMRVGEQAKQFQAAVDKNSKAQTESEKKNAEIDLINSFRAFVKLHN